MCVPNLQPTLICPANILHACTLAQATSWSFDFVAKLMKHGLDKWSMKWMENRLVCQVQRVSMIQNLNRS